MDEKIIRINASISHHRTKYVVKDLKRIGVANINIAAGRVPSLEAPVGILRFLSSKDALKSQPVDFVTFFVRPKDEELALRVVVQSGHLTIPGMGSAYSQEFTIKGYHPQCRWHELKKSNPPEANFYTNLVGISCVVNRGEGDAIARVVLESGAAVPTITFGSGKGIRDKLGLLRITIPAEKEVLNLVTTSWDADDLLESMINVGKLDQPGKGFINSFPIKQGIINTKVSSDRSKHAASMDQVILALDNIQGNMEWRRNMSQSSYMGRRRNFFSGIDLGVICNDGYGHELVQAAMEAGAQGATIEKISLRGKCEESNQDLSRAREICKMLIPSDKAIEIVTSMEKAGAFADKAKSIVFQSEVDQAFTYMKSAR